MNFEKRCTVIVVLIGVLLVGCTAGADLTQTNNQGKIKSQETVTKTALKDSLLKRITPIPSNQNPTPRSTNTPTSTPSFTLSPSITASPSPSLTPTPPHPLTIEYLRQLDYSRSKINIEEAQGSGTGYNKYIASYHSEGLKIYAFLTVPSGKSQQMVGRLSFSTMVIFVQQATKLEKSICTMSTT